MNWLDKLIDEYYLFLKEKTLLEEDTLSGWITIKTPFIGIFNDGIDIYAKKQNEKIILSDDGQTIRNLELSGSEITRSSKRKELFSQILLNYGVELNGTELTIEADEKNFPQKKLGILSAITIASVFREDVQSFLDEQETTSA